MATYQEFAKAIKVKYPVYSSVDDLELAKKFVEKYPTYKDKVQIESLKEPTAENVETAKAEFTRKMRKFEE